MRASATRNEPPLPRSHGPDESFDAFYRAQVDRVYRALTVTLVDPHLAREATDEAMVRAYARWPQLAGYDNPGGWVFRVGRNWATSRWRRFRRESPLSDRVVGGVVAPPDPLATEALIALGRLGLPQREVVVCRVLLELSTTETAEILGIPEGTVKSRLARSLATLRTELGEEGQP